MGVLRALSRGMSESYAARADGITVAQVRQIAADARAVMELEEPKLGAKFWPGSRPCEVCGEPVVKEYIERTGRIRHGHH